jgi:single-strand DNA-binding protein
MAKGINKVSLLGNIAREPEIKATTAGELVANLCLATNDMQKDSAGIWQTRTEWHHLVASGQTAEVVRDQVKKGSQLFIEGKLRTRSWVSKVDGTKRYKTEIFVSELVLIQGNRQSGNRMDANSQETATAGRELSERSFTPNSEGAAGATTVRPRPASTSRMTISRSKGKTMKFRVCRIRVYDRKTHQSFSTVPSRL